MFACIKKTYIFKLMHIKKHSDVLKMIDTKKNSFDILITQGAGSVSAVTELIKNKWKN